MLTVRATKTPPSIRLSEGRANVSAMIAVDVYVVCNQTTPTPEREVKDPACDNTMPLAFSVEMVRERERERER